MPRLAKLTSPHIHVLPDPDLAYRNLLIRHSVLTSFQFRLLFNFRLSLDYRYLCILFLMFSLLLVTGRRWVVVRLKTVVGMTFKRCSLSFWFRLIVRLLKRFSKWRKPSMSECQVSKVHLHADRWVTVQTSQSLLRLLNNKDYSF